MLLPNLLHSLKIDSMYHRNQRQRWRVFLSKVEDIRKEHSGARNYRNRRSRKKFVDG